MIETRRWIVAAAALGVAGGALLAGGCAPRDRTTEADQEMVERVNETEHPNEPGTHELPESMEPLPPAAHPPR